MRLHTALLAFTSVTLASFALGCGDDSSNTTPVGTGGSAPDQDAAPESSLDTSIDNSVVETSPEAKVEAAIEAAAEAEAEASAPPPAVGSACWVSEDCPQGAVCWTSAEGLPGGYCVVDGCKEEDCPKGSVLVSFTNGATHCLAACDTDDNCRKNEGYVCDQGVCFPGAGTIPPGGACGTDDQCAGGANAACIQQVGFIGGYCVVLECDNDCPTGSVCAAILTSGKSACIPTCESTKDCRKGYVCVDNAESAWNKSCFPDCNVDDDCPASLGCREDEDWGGLVCKYVEAQCAEKFPKGACPTGQVCAQGACADFSCKDTVLEPNESLAAAVAAPNADTAGLQICPNDNDWFKLAPIKSDVLYDVGIDSNYSSGDLDIDLTDSTGKALGDARNSYDEYHPENPPGPANIQMFSLVGAPGSSDAFFHVSGIKQAVNNYGLLVREIPFKDAANCQDLYTVEQCRAMNCSKSHDPSQLLIFPEPNPKDPFLGEGVFFKNALYAFGNPEYTSTTRRYARREVLMILRNAIHAVQEAFPGTTPLGIGDVGLHDGTTPNGHPNGTHYYGANLDVSYYIDPQYLGTFGNMAYRQICCDAATLKDWHCVDTKTTSAEYGTCIKGSETTQIVDVKRTAMFLAKVAGSGRLRVVGVEQKVKKALVTALNDLQTQGLITATEKSAASKRMASTDDDPSWLWHFNHMHLSFCADDCTSSASLGDVPPQGPWPGVPLQEQAARAREFYVTHFSH